MRECPRCGSSDIHRSHARSLYERIRRSMTRRRLFRCHSCDWRGWAIPIDTPPSPTGPKDPVDLEKLDADLRNAIDKLDASLDTK
jgi:predicted RNA-binding Zn-ribbon protein involved in translation (DUF1610 family)